MWGMTVEGDTGDILVVMKMNQETGKVAYFGNAILSFHIMLSLYCEQPDTITDAIQWFQELNEHVSFDLCHQGEIFWTSIISGYMDYNDDEYKIYTQRTKSDVTEENFLKGLEYARNAWKDARTLAGITMELAKSLRKMPQIQTHWFFPQGTADGMETISNTINLLIDRCAEKVRINIQ